MNDQNEYAFNWYAAWITEALFFVCVNCFVMISGYHYSSFNYRSIRDAIKRIFPVCQKVWIYSIGIPLVCLLFFSAEISKYDMLCSILPIYTNRFWFVNVYLGLCLLAPFLNKFIDGASKKQFQYLLAILLCLFSIFPMLSITVSWRLDDTGGYGIIWFVVLYFSAAYLRKFDISLSKAKALLLYVGSSLVIFLAKLTISILDDYIPFFVGYQNYWYQYNNLFVFIASVCLFLFFLSIKIKNPITQTVISSIRGSTFSVYIIHAQINMQTINGHTAVLWNDFLNSPRHHNSPFMLLYMLGGVLVLFVLCIAVDLIVSQIIAWVSRAVKYLFRLMRK